MAWFQKLLDWLERLGPPAPPPEPLSPEELRALADPGWNVTDPSAWDEFWETRFRAAKSPPYELTHLSEIVKPLIPRIRSEGMTRVLDAGCGIHLEVKAFAALGLRSVGLDLSPVAVRYAESCDQLASHEGRFFAEANRRPGFSLPAQIWHWTQAAASALRSTGSG